ncbi:MAG TPA: adenylate/guanylate cyclase domain-containing protein [Ramlibacter sp.]|jgi:class 3 adenylate cyclase|nr:adenylate/guanylate cyclase domain-containing protein [Ramlibacter sp.]
MASVVFADLVGSTGIFERLGDETAGHFVTQLTTALAKIFEQHNGRVVKTLGDGLFVVFPTEGDALTACIAIQRRLSDRPVYPGGMRTPVQMQMGLESGEVVEIEGDCYGDAVNSAARLADLAGADQILTTQRVRANLPPDQQELLRSLGPMYLRGKAEATEVYRVEWDHERDSEATVMGVSMLAPRTAATQVEVTFGDQKWRIGTNGERITLGRSRTADVNVNDTRVSRLHAAIEWIGGHFVLSDASSFGTWVYFGNQDEPVILRRTECYLIGQGQIALGCDRNAEAAPIATFSVVS